MYKKVVTDFSVTAFIFCIVKSANATWYEACKIMNIKEITLPFEEKPFSVMYHYTAFVHIPYKLT